MNNTIDNISFRATLKIKAKTGRIAASLDREADKNKYVTLLQRFRKYADEFEHRTADYPNDTLRINLAVKDGQQKDIKRGDILFTLEQKGHNNITRGVEYNIYETKTNFINKMINDFFSLCKIRKMMEEILPPKTL